MVKTQKCSESPSAEGFALSCCPIGAAHPTGKQLSHAPHYALQQTEHLHTHT